MKPTVTLHCKPYTAHYLKLKYGAGGSIIDLPKKSNLKKLFLSVLTKNFHPSAEFNKEVYSSCVDIKIRVNDLSQHGICLSPGFQHFINGIFEEKIKNELGFYIHAQRQMGLKWKEAIYAYQYSHQFTEEVFSYSAIERSYERYLEDAKKTFCTSVGKLKAA